MKKLISILGLSLGIGLNVFSQKDIRDMNFEERIFNRIECERTFGKCYFPEYVIGTERSRNNGEYMAAYYDFDHNNIPEVIAYFKSDVNDSTKCPPLKSKKNASIVMIDKNNDGIFDEVYSDLDGDGILEDLDIFYKKPQIEKFEDDVRDFEDIPYKT